jgi:5-methylcytosine-specific restriction endonuclease McrA
MRKEFSKVVKRRAAERSRMICERQLWKPGEVCTRPAKEFDHLLEDGLGGDNSFENVCHLCVPCHKAKSKENNPVMRAADKQRDSIRGVRPKMKGRPIAQRPKPEKPPKRFELPPLPRRSLYTQEEP